MLLTLFALIAVLAVASALWDGHRSGRHPLRLLQFRPAAPLAGPAFTARIGPDRRRR
jgi:hypothetical protein